jgi:subtilase family serine protease
MFSFGKNRPSPPSRNTNRSRSRTCSIEQLESRQLLAVTGIPDIAVHPQAVQINDSPGLWAFTPAQISHTYGFDQLKRLSNNAVADGTGQTIAIVDAQDDPNIAGDLATFDSEFGLPAPPSFQKVDEYGGKNYPAPDSGWATEISLDVEWAHAMAPGANILLVEAASENLSDLLTAVDYARRQPGVSVVSMSWGGPEFQQETQLDGYFTTPAQHGGVSFVVASGDTHSPASWPATSPNCLGVGGTTLTTLDASGSYRSEIGWAYSTGGPSQFETEPNYQSSVQNSGMRETPDVAYDSDPNTGYWVCDTYETAGECYTPGWLAIGGTSAATPQWAAIIAIANQGRAAKGVNSLLAAPADIYQLPTADFHDITSGFNGYSAKPGYDMVTGRGTPLANRVIPDLISSSNVQTAERVAAAGLTRLPLRIPFLASQHPVAEQVATPDDTSEMLPPEMNAVLSDMRRFWS